MFETDSVALLNAFINHPSIRPTIEAGDQRLDATDFLERDDTVVYACQHGVVMFAGGSDGVYEGHVAFLPSARGKAALACCKDALDGLFSRHGARLVVAAVPLALRPARMLCRMLGFKAQGFDTERGIEHFVYEGAE